MTKKSPAALLSFQSDNRKPVLSHAEGSAIQNPRLVGLLAISLTFAFGGAVATAQQPKKNPRIGFLTSSSASAYANRVEAFLGGLRDLGYVEGQNVVIEYRYAEGKNDRPP